MLPGAYDLPFSFDIPGDCPIPPSHEARVGSVRYYLTSKIRRPGIKLNDTKKVIITLIPKVETNKPEYDAATKVSDSKTLCCCCCADGPIKVDFEAPRRACAPGDHMEVKVDIDNKSSKSFQTFEIVLREDITYYAGFRMNHTQHYTNNINVTTYTEAITAMGEFSKKIDIVIPQAGPSFGIEVGKAIKRSYALGVFIKIPGPHASACICAPIILGTTPSNASAAPAASSSSSAAAAAPAPGAGDVALPAAQDDNSEPDYLTKLNQQMQNDTLGTTTTTTGAAGDSGVSSSEYILSSPAGGKKDRRDRNRDAGDADAGDEWTGMYGY